MALCLYILPFLIIAQEARNSLKMIFKLFKAELECGNTSYKHILTKFKRKIVI